MPIWSKGGDATNALVHEFTVGDDYLCDRQLAPYDVLGCIAHATMLGKTKIIPEADAKKIVDGLRVLYKEHTEGKWTVEQSDEDVHSKIEALLVTRLGESAKRLHTGRSRNDQVLTAVRLYQKDRVLTLATSVMNTAEALLNKAKEYEFHPFPGYTHLQRGMPSSLGMFFGAHACALLDNLLLFEAAYALADRCPLGSGASYGVGLPLDRKMTSAALGFEREPSVCMADANSRGKCETATLDAVGAVFQDLSRFATDMVFFTAGECGFFTIGAGFTTGSSIMPQKKNLDLFELIRGRCARFMGVRTGLYATTVGLYSGYQRDLQDTKALLMDGCRLAEQALAVVATAVPTLIPNREKILATLTPDIYATDEAYKLVMQGVPFRDAYVQVGRNLDKVAVPDHDATVRSRTHVGSTGNLGLDDLKTRLAKERDGWKARSDKLHAKWELLLAAPAAAEPSPKKQKTN